jgi:hypothetical protein
VRQRCTLLRAVAPTTHTHTLAGFFEVMRWQRERSKLGVSLDGWLEGIPHPTPADFAAAFPLAAPNYTALANPPADAVQACWVRHVWAALGRVG